jgi:hypothetical protein
MSLAEDDSQAPLQIGGTRYALKKLERWKAEGPTERNKQMARFLLDHGSFGTQYSHELTTDESLLVDLALQWGDLPMWKEVLKKSASAGSELRLSPDLLIRAWSVFTFDCIKQLSVHFHSCLIPCFLAHIPHLVESSAVFVTGLA